MVLARLPVEVSQAKLMEAFSTRCAGTTLLRKIRMACNHYIPAVIIYLASEPRSQLHQLLLEADYWYLPVTPHPGPVLDLLIQASLLVIN